MKDFTTYLIFDGKAREAMNFYKECLGGDLSMFTYGEGPGPCSSDEKNNIMHARLVNGNAVLMASDNSTASPAKLNPGNNFSISINCEDIAESERIFKRLSAGGKVMMELQETFWAIRFAMFTDKFGINWMLNLEKKH